MPGPNRNTTVVSKSFLPMQDSPDLNLSSFSVFSSVNVDHVMLTAYVAISY